MSSSIHTITQLSLMNTVQLLPCCCAGPLLHLGCELCRVVELQVLPAVPGVHICCECDGAGEPHQTNAGLLQWDTGQQVGS